MLAGQHAALVMMAATLPAAALGQSAAPDPLGTAPTAAPSYRSAFEGYRSFRVEELPAWPSVNETVRSVGGHTGSIRDSGEKAAPSAPARSEASEAPAPKAAPSTPVTTEPPASHGRDH
jgi:hypothetical protein